MSRELTNRVLAAMNENGAPDHPCTTALLLVLAHYAHDDGIIPPARVRTQSWYSTTLGCNERTIRKGLTALSNDGWIVRLPRSKTAPARTQVCIPNPALEGRLAPQGHRPPGAALPAPQGRIDGERSLHSSKTLGLTPSPAEGREEEDLVLLQPPSVPSRDESFKVADYVLATRRPKPTLKRVAIAAMAQRYLDNGDVPARELAEAMRYALGLTDVSIDIELRRARGGPAATTRAIVERTSRKAHEEFAASRGGRTGKLTPEEIQQLVKDKRQ